MPSNFEISTSRLFRLVGFSRSPLRGQADVLCHDRPVDFGLNGPERAVPGGAETYLYAARAVRDFGDGFVAILLPVYLTAMGLGALEVGVVATLALLGSALMTLAIGLLGARFDQRKLLIAASGLMVATGLAFAVSSTYRRRSSTSWAGRSGGSIRRRPARPIWAIGRQRRRSGARSRRSMR
jgi:hypothetical protein